MKVYISIDIQGELKMTCEKGIFDDGKEDELFEISDNYNDFKIVFISFVFESSQFGFTEEKIITNNIHIAIKSKNQIVVKGLVQGFFSAKSSYDKKYFMQKHELTDLEMLIEFDIPGADPYSNNRRGFRIEGDEKPAIAHRTYLKKSELPKL